MKPTLIALVSFTAGLLIAMPAHTDAFYRQAIKDAYAYGQQSVLLKVLDNGEIKEVADATN